MVQGVGYRWYCLRQARNLGLFGWVKNRPDGSVEILAEGDRGALEAMIKELKIGPSSASVTRIDVDWREFTGEHDSFDVAF
jgi:acylphosphatase